MQITVRLFATLRDRAGTSSVQIEVQEPATISDLLSVLTALYPALEASIPTALIAVNQEYSRPEDTLHPGDEVALFPPVSGGSGEPDFPEYFAIATEQLNFDTIIATISRPETGAVCVFSGAVRGTTVTPAEVRTTDRLEYEAYTPMAEKMLRQVASEIRERYPKVQGIAIVQRIGTLQVGETTIFVACAAGHRDDGCFEAARFGIDRVKEIVPVWKKEIGADAEVWVEGHYHPTPADASRSATTATTHSRPSMSGFEIGCPACGERYPLDDLPLRCACGSPIEVIAAPGFDPSAIDPDLASMWRYRRFLLPDSVEPVTMNEGWTPLIQIEGFGRTIHCKLEMLNPSGAFKDRGASTLVSLLKAQGVSTVHDDSSGNAGAALAAYAARGGIGARLYVPESASPVKLGQIRLYGADLVSVPGPRSAARTAAEQIENTESCYASHIDHPFAVFAYKSIAYELWEQLDRRAPEVVVLPLGHGSQLLGIAWGFEDLQRAGFIAQMPRLYGVQARGCAPMWAEAHPSGSASDEGTTLAEGIRIAHPIRSKRVIEAVRASEGDVLAVGESDILTGIRELAQRGLAVEPTSAVIWAALGEVSKRLPQSSLIVASITGSGLKYPGLDRLVQDSAVREGMAVLHSSTMKG